MALNPGTEAGSVNSALTDRQCLINISNRVRDCSLVNPRCYTESGTCASPLPPTIPPKGSGSTLFVKTPYTPCGAVGVVTCDVLFGGGGSLTAGKIAIMFSNPFDMIEYSNMFAVGVFEKSKECNKELYEEMYNQTNDSFVRSQASDGVLVYKGKQVKLSATMSDGYQTEIKLEVSEAD